MRENRLDRRRRPDALALTPEQLRRFTPLEIAAALKSTRFFAWAWRGLGFLTRRDHLPAAFVTAGDETRWECFTWEEKETACAMGIDGPCRKCCGSCPLSSATDAGQGVLTTHIKGSAMKKPPRRPPAAPTKLNATPRRRRNKPALPRDRGEPVVVAALKQLGPDEAQVLQQVQMGLGVNG